MSLLEQVRKSCRAVAEQASFVHINYDLIPSYSAELPLERIVHLEQDPKHYLGQGSDTVSYFLALDSINFGSGYFPHLRKRLGMSGYFTIASSLTDYYKEYGPVTAQSLSGLTIEDCAKIFGQDLENVPILELMQLFTTSLNDLGRYVLDRFDGSFVGLIKEADSSAERLVQLLIEMPYFKDTGTYNGLYVAFYKRAQLTAADLSIAFNGQELGYFYDLDRLTIFADNVIPRVLRFDGILRYEDELATRIDKGVLVPSGSAEEIEIRACAVYAVELLVEELCRSRHTVTAQKLDYLLWNRGSEQSYKMYPSHRTRTVFY